MKDDHMTNSHYITHTFLSKRLRECTFLKAAWFLCLFITLLLVIYIHWDFMCLLYVCQDEEAYLKDPRRMQLSRSSAPVHGGPTDTSLNNKRCGAASPVSQPEVWERGFRPMPFRAVAAAASERPNPLHLGHQSFGTLPGRQWTRIRNKCSVHFISYFVKCTQGFGTVNPFTPKSDQCQISPAASRQKYHITQYEELGFS